MAKKLSEDQIKWILSLDASKAEEGIHKLTKANNELEQRNKEVKQSMRQLEMQGKQNQAGYRLLSEELKKNNTQIKSNRNMIKDLDKQMGLNNLSMSQLKRRASDLQRQLESTSKALHPQEYAKLDKQLTETRSRMSELKNEGKMLEQNLTSLVKSKGIMLTFFGNLYSRVANYAFNAITGMKDFAAEGIRMAASADGVVRAFNALNQPDLLKELRKATKGTVNDLELMKAVTMSNFFRIPLQDLAKYLQFAQIRAQQTGQSVEYMTNSIVTGLGRQSLKILDNLGLSAAEINEEVAKTGDFMQGVANIVNRELVKAGENYISAADKAAARTVELQNKQMELGRILLPLKAEWASLTHTFSMGLADTVIWMAKNRSVIFTLISAISSYAVASALATTQTYKDITATRASIILYKVKALLLNNLKGVVLLYTAAKSLLTKNTLRANAAMKLFNATCKASTIGLVVSLVAAAITAFAMYEKRSSAAEKATRNFNKTLAVEKTNLNNLFEQLKKTNPGTSDRIRLVKELNEKYPGLIDNYTLEKASLQEITRAQKQANDALVQRIALQMESESVSQLVKESIENQQKSIKGFYDAVEGITGKQVSGILHNSMQTFLDDSSKTFSDFMSVFGKHLSTSDPFKHVKLLTSFNNLRKSQMEMDTGLKDITKSFAPYTKAVTTASDATKSLSDEEKKNLMEATSLIQKLQKERQNVQDTWLENNKENIDKKNKELERIDNEIRKWQELGKTKKDAGKDPSGYSSPVNQKLTPADNTHQANLLALKKTMIEEKQTQEQYNRSILAEDKRYYQERLQLLSGFSDSKKPLNKKMNDEILKLTTESQTKLFETEASIEKQRLDTLQKFRKEDLDDQANTTKAQETFLTNQLASKKITQEQFDVAMAVITQNDADCRLQIEKQYLEDVNSLELSNGQLKADAVRQANEQVLTADKSAADARMNSEKTFQKNMDEMRGMAQIDMSPQDKLKAEYDAQLILLESFYQASLEYARQHGQDETAITQLYTDAKENIEKKYNQDKKDLVQKTEDEIKGIAGNALSQSIADIFNAIQKFKDNVNATPKEIAGSMLQIASMTAKALGQAFDTFQQIEIDNIEAKYNAEIEAAQGNSEEVERLEQEKAQKKLNVEKKYADVQFAIKVSEIIASTGLSIMQAFAQLGPIGGAIAAVMLATTSGIQIAAANAEHNKVKNMTLSGSSSGSGGNGVRVATGRESGGKIDVRRAQDGKFFPNADYDPDARGFIDRPTVIVGEGPVGRSKEWIASNAAVENPTIAPFLNLLDKHQQAGDIATVDMNQIIRQRMAGFSSGGSVDNSVSQANTIIPAQPPYNGLPVPLVEKLTAAIVSLNENGVSSSVVLSELEAKQELRRRSRLIGSKK